MLMKATTAYRIYDAKNAVGHILVTLERDYTPKMLAETWGSKNVLKGWKLPHTFDYLWIDEVFIHHEFRRRGFGAKALRRLIATRRKPTFIALGPGEIDTKNPVGYRALCDFYRKLGFTLKSHGKDRYAFYLTGQEKS